MTAQEVFYYTVSVCSWLFIIMTVIIFYRINQLISRGHKVINQVESTVNSIPEIIKRGVFEVITFLMKRIGGE